MPIKIAIADDHDIFKEGIEMVLKYSGDLNLMIKASNGLDLLEQVKKDAPDVVLLDLKMPVMDGLATLQELKRLYPIIKVIIFSMNENSPQVLKAMTLGADAYLLKSSDPAAICKMIRGSCRPGSINGHIANLS